MLQAPKLCRILSFSGSLVQSACVAQLGGYFTPAVSRSMMEGMRQRKHVTDRVVTRSHAPGKRTLILQTIQDGSLQPAAKKRKNSAKPQARGLADHTSADNSAVSSTQAAQTSGSANTTFDSVPAISDAPAGVPASTPADLPADPDVLHCWTKDNMAAAAAQLAQRDAGRQCFLHQACVSKQFILHRDSQSVHILSFKECHVSLQLWRC